MGTWDVGFRRLWASAGAANLADGILLAGLPVLATTVTDSPAAIAGVTTAIMLPMALTALPAGAAADRLDRRRLLLGTNLLRALGLGAIAASLLAWGPNLVAIYLAAALAGGTEMFVDTTAQTAVPGLVPAGRLGAANARLGGTQVVLNDAVGAPVGGALAVWGGVLLLTAPALMYGYAAVVLARVRFPARRTPASAGPALAGLRAEIREGARHLAHHAVLRRLAVVNGVSNLGNAAFFAVFVLFVIGPLGLPRASYGFFLAAVAVGGVLGSVAAEGVLRRVGMSGVLRLAASVTAIGYAIVSTASDRWVVAAVAGALGAVSMVWNVGSRVLRQTLVPDQLLGRVTATMALVALIATPVGATLGGIVAQVAGVRAAGAVAVASNLLALLLLRPLSRHAIAQAGQTPVTRSTNEATASSSSSAS